MALLVGCLFLHAPCNAESPYLDRHYQEGLLLMQQGRFNEALSELKQSIAQEAHSETYFALGVAYFQRHQLNLANNAYQQGMRLLPPEDLAARIQGGLGDVFFENGDYHQAITAYRRALQAHPEWIGVRLQLASAYLRLERYSSALSESEQILQSSTPLAEIHYLRGLIYLARRDWPAALKELNQLSQYPEHFIEAHQHLNLLYRMQKKYPEAIQIAEELIQSDKSQSPGNYKLAAETWLESLTACLPETDCFNSDAVQHIKGHLERWLLTAPDQAQAYFLLGQVEQLQGHWLEALRSYQQAFTYFPERLDYRLKLATMYQTLNQKDRAYQLLSAIPPERFSEEALWQEMPKWFETNPELVKNWQSNINTQDLSPLLKGRYLFWKAYFLWQNPEFHERKDLWQEAEKSLYQEPEGLMIQALKLWQAGEKKWSARILLQIHHQRPDWWLPQDYLGQYYLNHDLTEAQKWLGSAHLQNPISLPLALNLLGTYSPHEAPVLAEKLLQSFPEEKRIQEFYLQIIQQN